MTNKIKCIIVDDEPIARSILETHLKKMDIVEIEASCKNAVEAFNAISSNEIDLVFLDINMPEIDGLSFAKSITADIKIIFTTAYREYAVDGFDLQAVDYLLKPISFERLSQAVQRVVDSQEVVQVNEPNGQKEKEFMFVRADRKMVKIDYNDINYIESLGDYVKIHLTDKTIVTRESITNIEAKIPASDFIRIHRSFIISISKIEIFTNEFVEVGRQAIPISRTYKKDVLNRLESL